MQLKYLVLCCVFLGVGCSDSNDNDDSGSAMSQNDMLVVGTSGSEGDMIQFSEPDLDGSSDLARMSYPVARDLSRELVSGSYLDLYFDTDESVRQILYEAIGGIEAFQNGEIEEDEVQAPFNCPEGGSVRASYTDRNGPAGIFTGVFSQCGLGEYTLDGTLVRNQDSGVAGAGGFLNVAVSFDELVIDAGVAGVLTVTGSAFRNRSNSGSDILMPGNRGTCALERDNLSLVESSELPSARLERPGISGSVTVSESSYARSDNKRYDATSSEATCPEFREVSEDGAAVVTFAEYGVSMLSGQAAVTTSITTTSDDDSSVHSASQVTELPDGSSVEVTALSDLDACMVQVDIGAQNAIVSFFDTFCFTPLEF